jgi:SAM-dependent methyltransferase
MKNRSYTLELLDAEEIPENDLIQNLKELKFINRYLGGHDVVLKGFRFFESRSESFHVLEIGSGGGDNLMALKEKFPQQRFTGVDLKKVCTDYAKSQDPTIDWVCEDVFKFKSEKPIDVIFNSLFCHHFTDDQLVMILKWMNDNAKKGFFIGDLHRHTLAYWTIKLLTSLFSKSYLVKNDAPLSVKRGFTSKEWRLLLYKAGIEKYKIKWCWAFRHLIVVKK